MLKVRSALATVTNKSPIPTVMVPRPATKGSTVLFIAVPVTSAAITVIIVAMIILYKLRRYSKCLFVWCLTSLGCLPVKWNDTNQRQQEMKCGVVGNLAYNVVHVQGLAGDGLEPDYNMENNPLYEMRMPKDTHTRQKQQLVLVCMRMLTMWLCEEEECNQQVFFCFPLLPLCLQTGIIIICMTLSSLVNINTVDVG